MKRPSASTPTNTGKHRKREETHLPVSTLCGFLGAGKTTLLKHILESRHAEDGDFRCAVIVNDMAELNIDKSLIDQSALVQSDEVIAMQNGCVCCTLKNDLLEQILGLAKQKTFDYMIIEASGVSEPAQIAQLFADCDEDHDHDEAHGHKESLNEVARLDTCVTVVDSADYLNKLEMIVKGPESKSIPHLLAEQIEYANVIILNKTDLVSQVQLDEVKDQVSSLNPKAKILTSKNSKIDVMEVVNTHLYKADDFATFHQQVDEAKEEEVFELPCCIAKTAKGEAACCVSLGSRMRNSGKSKVVLASAQPSTFARQRGKTQTARHTSRFGITSFLYRARRPFHPERFDANLVKKFFLFHDGEEEEEAESGKAGKKTVKGKAGAKERARKEKERQEKLRRQQKEAKEKEALRTEKMGCLFRSKGFIWLANRHDIMGTYSSAGNVLSIEFPVRWKALEEKAWLGSEEEKAKIRKDWVAPWADRRQDLVFIGTDLQHEAIQQILDDCLLTDEELAMGIDGWKAAFGDLLLDAASDDDSEEEDDEEDAAKLGQPQGGAR